MSVRVSAMVFEGGPLDLAEHSVMISLAENASDTGEAWPGVPLLARKSRLSERSVLRVLKALEAAGWISVRRRVMVRRGCDRVCGSVYHVNLAKLQAEARVRGDLYLDPKPVARRTREAHDTVSPAMPEDRENIGQPERAHDTVSPAAGSAVEQVTAAPEQVTESPGAHDTALADLLLNQRDTFCNRQGTVKEPSLPPKPPQGGAHGMPPRPLGEAQGDELGVDSDGLTLDQREELAEINAMRARMPGRSLGPLSPEGFLQSQRMLPAEPTRGTLPPGSGRRQRRDRWSARLQR